MQAGTSVFKVVISSSGIIWLEMLRVNNSIGLLILSSSVGFMSRKSGIWDSVRILERSGSEDRPSFTFIF